MENYEFELWNLLVDQTMRFNRAINQETEHIIALTARKNFMLPHTPSAATIEQVNRESVVTRKSF